ncbi:MAG: RNA-binding protein [Cyanobacteria bacterium M5B4]|nr:MAG: RNA-binding protein [Cyanobacteria bacterium M5B4]
MSVRLYVGNLPAELDRQALEQVFHESGESLTVKVITDRKTGRCRGFGFVTVENDEQADSVIERFNGFDFNGAVLKLEKALPRQKEKGDEEESNSAIDHEVKDRNATEAQGEEKGEEKIPPKRSKKRRNKKSSNRPEFRSSSSSSEFHQPDPRWASELEEFKQRLLASQSN